jgi:hypothetical protein
LQQSLLLYKGRDIYVYFDGGGGRRWILSIFVRAFKHTKSEHFVSRKISTPFPRFIKNASIHVYSF